MRHARGGALWRQRLVITVLVALSGCASTWLNPTPAVGPHPIGWRGTHGRFVQRGGGVDKVRIDSGQRCDFCHTTHRTADGTVPRSPMTFLTCYSCHEGPKGEGL